MILTGSHVFGPVNKDSDIDIVLLDFEAQELWNFLRTLKLSAYRTSQQDRYDAGYYFKLGKLKFNIIIAYNEDDLVRWNYATQKMKAIDPVEDKDDRIETFREFFGEMLAES